MHGKPRRTSRRKFRANAGKIFNGIRQRTESRNPRRTSRGEIPGERREDIQWNTPKDSEQESTESVQKKIPGEHREDIQWNTPEDSAQAVRRIVTLSEAVATGVITNPEYGVVANSRRATDEELHQARSLYFPSIDLRADTGYEHSDDPATRGGLDEHGRENLMRYDVGLTLTQLLFDGWETYSENERQESRVLSAAHRVRETAELIGLSIVEAYMEVVRQRELLLISRKNVAAHLVIMRQIKDSAEAGRLSQTDVEQIKARVAVARAQEANTRQSLQFAEAAYIREVGDRPPQELVKPTMPADALSSDLEREVRRALHQNPTIDIFEADIEVSRAEVRGAKAVFWPQLDLQLNAREGRDLNGVRERDTSASALLQMNWNLYRGGGDTARVREFINREAQAREVRNEAARNVENDVRQTWARMVGAKERARQFTVQVEANTEVVKAYKDQFDLNRRTLLDVLNSQNELFVSHSNVVNAQFLEIFAVYRLLALRSELLSTLGVGYPPEADPDTIKIWYPASRRKHSISGL